jgi:hypothetical protein
MGSTLTYIIHIDRKALSPLEQSSADVDSVSCSPSAPHDVFAAKLIMCTSRSASTPRLHKRPVFFSIASLVVVLML